LRRIGISNEKKLGKKRDLKIGLGLSKVVKGYKRLYAKYFCSKSLILF